MLPSRSLLQLAKAEMCFTSILVSAAFAKRGATAASSWHASAGDSGAMAAENGTRTFAFLRPSLWQHASVAPCAFMLCSAAVTSCSEERTGSRPGRVREAMLDQSRVTRTLQVYWRISREPAGQKKTIFDAKGLRRTSF
jgi:hypothetical protein